MNLPDLQIAVNEIKAAVQDAVTKASYGGKNFTNGLEAKAALIRSGTLIQRIHELTKRSLHVELERREIPHQIHPDLGLTSPEISVWGLLKKKKQDIVVLVDGAQHTREEITEGPLLGGFDLLGATATKSSLVIGVRSQLSSVNKNFDTLMERAIAETMNLRLRHPYLVMGEVHLLAVKDYDEQAMKKNQIAWKSKFTNIERFISFFNGISHRVDHEDIRQSFKYERSVLLLVDFSQNPPKIYTTKEELQADRIVSQTFTGDYQGLSPSHFAADILDKYTKRHAS
jgi:hypothetical protein